MKVTWEKIDDGHGHYLCRAKVFGGWLVLVTNDVMTPMPESHYGSRQNYEWRSSITFVPDPEHKWN